TSTSGTKSGSKGSTKSTTKSSTTTTSGTTSKPTMNPVAAKISSKPSLNTKVTGMLPAGMSLNDASKGFKNQGQFIAALHVSQNLGIPFADLKTDMTGPKKMSLGQSIQDCKRTANSTTETQKAEK